MTSTTLARHRALQIAKGRRYSQTGEGKALRLQAGLALQHIAEGVGVGVTTVWRWEQGRNTPCGDAAARWADLLDALAAERTGGPDAA
jgi:transcriptional regulator with XRE-family HTH domain